MAFMRAIPERTDIVRTSPANETGVGAKWRELCANAEFRACSYSRPRMGDPRLIRARV